MAGGLNLYGFANGDPINFRDPFGLSPWGKLVKIGVRGFKWVSKKVSREALDEAVSNGDDVIMSSRREAFDIADRHSPGGRAIGPERSPGPGNRSHYHTNPRNGSHIFFSIAAGLTVSNYVSEDASGLVKFGAGVLDFFNPAAILQDGVDVYDMVSGDDPPSADPEPDESPPGGGS